MADSPRGRPAEAGETPDPHPRTPPSGLSPAARAVLARGGCLGFFPRDPRNPTRGEAEVAALLREILALRAIPGLYAPARRIPRAAGRLLAEGAGGVGAADVARLVAALNDCVLDRLLTLLQEETGPPPVPFCWLLMGSGGRREQTFCTDQDNALVYRDPAGPEQARACAEYFAAFSRAAVDHLAACGFPPCPGGMTAANPAWRMPAAAFRRFLDSLVAHPEPREVLHAAIFFDFRPGWGRLELGEALRGHVTARAGREHAFLHQLAVASLQFRPPLTLFRNFEVEREGEHRHTLNLKERGLAPCADFARLFALRHGVAETNTLDRLRLLRAGGHLSGDLLAEAAGAYEHLMHLRLLHQMGQIDAGREPDNHLDPAGLAAEERRALKDAFGVVGRLQSLVRDAFRLPLG